MAGHDLDRLSDDDLQRAALQALWPIPQLLVTGVIPVKQDEINAARQRCNKLREWLNAQDMSGRVRSAYQGWIDFCENSIVEAEDELQTGKRRREFEDGQRRLSDDRRRASQAASGLPRPPR